MPGESTTERLRVNPVLCDAYGHCAELLPQLISRDEWGYPILTSTPVPEHLRGDARRAVRACPKLALMLEREQPAGQRHGPERQSLHKD